VGFELESLDYESSMLPAMPLLQLVNVLFFTSIITKRNYIDIIKISSFNKYNKV